MLFIILVTAAAMTFATEVCALAFRCVARLFQFLYELCYDYCFLRYTFGIMWWIMWKAFWFTEQVLLYTSVFVTELLAGLAWFFCTFFALDCDIGRAAHQRTRRTSHLIRWACRRPFSRDEGIMPQDVNEISHKEAVTSSTTMPTATVVATEETIQTATVVAIHDDIESNSK